MYKQKYAVYSGFFKSVQAKHKTEIQLTAALFICLFVSLL